MAEEGKPPFLFSSFSNFGPLIFKNKNQGDSNAFMYEAIPFSKRDYQHNSKFKDNKLFLIYFFIYAIDLITRKVCRFMSEYIRID